MILISILFLKSQECSSQQPIITTEKYKVLHIPGDTVLYSDETIIPGTITWHNNGIPVDIPYSLVDNKIIPEWKSLPYSLDSVSVHFRILPFPFHQKQTLWDSTQIRLIEGDVFYNPATSNPRTDLIQSTGLEYDGALTRGFSVGNNQSLVFDSELNLQLNGNIGDGYHIKAAITDQNLPIQPDGTTQQIQEFDKVYIQIDKDQHSILAGDFDAYNAPGYFMRYNRKLKGAQYAYQGNKFNEPWNIRASAAVSRGKFTRQELIPSEGSQGPYPLHGENGELFIVVLAGSEKVYIDGQLLIRGEDADYIMDYNQSEITFMRRILINIRHRITIEFEYVQNSFQKSQNSFDAHYQKNKVESFVHFFQENDSKSVTGDLELTEEDLAILSMAGDASDQLQKSGISSSEEGYNSNLIQYETKDTLIGSFVYNDVLSWSTDPMKANLLVNFSEVGQGSGDYIISNNPSPNGRVYEWIAPDSTTGARNGNFSPIIPLYAPQQKQMMTAGGAYQWSKNGKVSAEFGVSRQDLNRYSELDDDDNIGGAVKVTIADVYPLDKSWSLSPILSYESTGSQFRIIDPYRNPEFARDWSLAPDASTGQEQLPSLSLRIGKGKSISSYYKYEGLFRSGLYNGNRHTGRILIDTSGWKLDAAVGVMNGKDAVNKSEFFRPNLILERVVRKSGDWRLGVKYFQDHNEVRNNISDALSPSSFVDNELSFYLKNDPEENTYFFMSYNLERPKLPFNNLLTLSEKVIEWNFGGHLYQLKDFKMDYTLKHRNVEPLLTAPGTKVQNLLGRIDMRADVWRKAFKWSLGYELGNGQEPKAEYTYIKVQKGEGNYIWIDNGNGIEEINEFELAPFPDQGEYLRFLVFNNQYIRTHSLGLQQTINVDLKQLKPTGWISKIAALSTYQMNRKIREGEESPYWNPFYQQYPDTSILNYSSTWRNFLYWNRSSSVYDLQLGQVRQQFQVLQTSGYEAKELKDLTFRGRLSLKKKMDVVLNVRQGIRENKSQFFEERNYTLSQFESGPELNVILKEKFRVTGSYQLLLQENTQGAEQFTSHKFSIEGVWRRNINSDIRAQMSMVEIDYTSLGNPTIDFAMLQGLQNGSNLLWSLQYNTRLIKVLLLTFQYNGRNTGDAKTIHTGSMQVRANF